MVGKPTRLDRTFEKKMREIMAERIGKKLSPCNRNSVSFPNATRLILKTPSWKKVEEELRTLPEKGGK